jgi:hypothetical protein
MSILSCTHMRTDVTLSLRESFHRLVDIGEAADALCRRLPDHRMAMSLRDLATQVETSIKFLSLGTLNAIREANRSPSPINRRPRRDD